MEQEPEHYNPYPELWEYLSRRDWDQVDKSHEEIKLLGEIYGYCGSVNYKVGTMFRGTDIGEIVRFYAVLFHNHQGELADRDYSNLYNLGFEGIDPEKTRFLISKNWRAGQKHRMGVKSIVKDNPKALWFVDFVHSKQENRPHIEE